MLLQRPCKSFYICLGYKKKCTVYNIRLYDLPLLTLWLLQYGISLKIYHNLKPFDMLFLNNTLSSCPIGLKFYKQHGSNKAMLSLKLHNVWANRDFVRFGFKVRFGRLCVIQQQPVVSLLYNARNSDVGNYCWWTGLILTVSLSLTLMAISHAGLITWPWVVSVCQQLYVGM